MPDRAGIRIPVRPRPRRGRGRPLDEQILFRVPALVNLAAALVFSLRVGSRLRVRLLSFLVGRASDAVNRGDLAFLKVAVYAPEAELSFAARLADFEPTYRGRDAAFEAYGKWRASWEEYRREPREVIDLGDRLLLLLRESGRGRESGVPIDAPFAMLVTFRRGRIIRHLEFSDWDQALAAAGINRAKP